VGNQNPILSWYGVKGGGCLAKDEGNYQKMEKATVRFRTSGKKTFRKGGFDVRLPGTESPGREVWGNENASGRGRTEGRKTSKKDGIANKNTRTVGKGAVAQEGRKHNFILQTAAEP